MRGHSITASLPASSPPQPSRSDSLVPPFLTSHAERRFLYSGARGTFWKDRTRPSTEERIKGDRSEDSRCDFLPSTSSLLSTFLPLSPCSVLVYFRPIHVPVTLILCVYSQ
uniref:Uncharacterized protein n=1 Tax=Caenorhabditis japonica TaxID=281687 RepID=A0A8R1IRF5_CAEJA